MACLIYCWISEIRNGPSTKKSLNISALELTWLFFTALLQAILSYQNASLHPLSPISPYDFGQII